MADNNRNWSLAVAQLAWMALVGRAGVVSTGTCQTFGAITHFAWLSTFMWTGITILYIRNTVLTRILFHNISTQPTILFNIICDMMRLCVLYVICWHFITYCRSARTYLSQTPKRKCVQHTVYSQQTTNIRNLQFRIRCTNNYCIHHAFNIINDWCQSLRSRRC